MHKCPAAVKYEHLIAIMAFAWGNVFVVLLSVNSRQSLE